MSMAPVSAPSSAYEEGQRCKVEIYTAPWVPDRRLESYDGPIEVTMRVPLGRGEGAGPDLQEILGAVIQDVVARIRSMAARGGSNTITGFELIVDPFGETLMVRARGRSCRLSAHRIASIYGDPDEGGASLWRWGT